MALLLVATPGASDANAYADVAAANLAATYRIGSNATGWAALTPDQKIQALVTAARDIDTLADTRADGWMLDFTGLRASASQSMQFPRSGLDDWTNTEIPDPVVSANIELAFTYVPAFASTFTGDVLSADPAAYRVKRKKVDVLETEYFEAGPAPTALERFPAIVQRLLSAVLTWTPVQQIWGGGSVVRGS